MDTSSCLVSRLTAYLDLTGEERDFIADLEKDRRHLARGDALPQVNGDICIGVLDQGLAVAMSQCGGKTRITRVFVPGDVVGLAELGGNFVGQDVRMQTDGDFCPFPRARIGLLLRKMPRLAALLLAIGGIEQLELRERLAAASTMTAEHRLIHFLLSIASRLAMPGIGSGSRVRLPMTQGEMGQVIGATDITVNRTMQQLVRRGWIEVDRPYIRLLARSDMEDEVQFVNRYDDLDLSWFAAP